MSPLNKSLSKKGKEIWLELVAVWGKTNNTLDTRRRKIYMRAYKLTLSAEHSSAIAHIYDRLVDIRYGLPREPTEPSSCPMHPCMLQKIRCHTPVRIKWKEENHLMISQSTGRVNRTREATCCRPPMLLITAAVEMPEPSDALDGGANCANSVAIEEFVICAR